MTHKGFSLIELLLVIALIGVISFLGTNTYRSYQQSRETIAIQNNITALFYALNIYYQKHCRSSELFHINFENISPMLKLANTHVVTSYQSRAIAAGYTATGHRPIYRLAVHITLQPNTPNNVVRWYANQFDAAEVNGKTLIFLRMPSYTRPQTDATLWLMRPGLRNFKLFFSNPASDSCGY